MKPRTLSRGSVNPTSAHGWNVSGDSEVKLQISWRETPTLPTVHLAQIEQSYFRFLPFVPAEIAWRSEGVFIIDTDFNVVVKGQSEPRVENAVNRFMERLSKRRPRPYNHPEHHA